MKTKSLSFLAASALLASPALATTLIIEEGNATFGRVGAVVVDFNSDAADVNWTDGVPQNGTSYPIYSVSFIKNNDDDTFANLWLGVYDSFSGPNSLGNLLGASTASVAWGAASAGTTFTWTFDNINLTAAENQQLVFAFQTDADSRTNILSGDDNPEGAIGLRRIPGFDSANRGIVSDGAAIVHGNGSQGLQLRVPHMTLVIPEPGTAMLGLLGLLGFLRRRR